MERSASRDFVRNLSEKINLEKNRIKRSRIHLQDSLNVILEILRSDKKLEIRSIRDFETNEISCFVDIYSPDDLMISITNILDENAIVYSHLKLNDYKFVAIVDLGKRIITSGSDHNIFSIEVVSKRLKTYKLKVSPSDPKFGYAVYEKNYHSLKYWFHENLKIQNNSIITRDLDRSKNELVFFDNYGNKIKVILNEFGEVESFSILPKKGRRKT
jgi:hypothetical protein